MLLLLVKLTLKWCAIIFLSMLAFCICAILLLNSNPKHPAICQSNLKQIALGMFMYEQDYGEKLPPAIFHNKTVGWANGLQPYLKSYPLLQCYAEKNPPQKTPQPDQPGFTDYWMNSNLAGAKDKDVNHAESTIMLGDGDGGSPASTASYAINHLPGAWLQLSDSPMKRHLDGANYAFADGHVKWLKPVEILQIAPQDPGKTYTFSVH